MLNLYWNYVRPAFEVQMMGPWRRDTGKHDTYIYPKGLNEELQKAFWDKIPDKGYFAFVVNDEQLGDFEKLFATPHKHMIHYRSEKFNNRNHLDDHNYLTLFIFQKRNANNSTA
jgi:hypothetical protein